MVPVCVGVGVGAPRGVRLFPGLPREAPATQDPELEYEDWEIMILFLCLFLKGLRSSHLCQRLLLEGIWVFVEKFGDVLVTRNIL